MKIRDSINDSKLELNEAVLILKYILNCEEMTIVANDQDEVSEEDFNRFK